MRKYFFEGPANIFLEGEGALWPLQILDYEKICYAVGASDTPIIINDYRASAIRAAYNAVDEQGQQEFADIFNQPSWIQVSEGADQVEIDLKELIHENSMSTLWLGVIHDMTMPVQPVVWQILKPVGKKSVAFAALITA